MIFAFYRVAFASLLLAAWFAWRRRPLGLDTRGRNLALLAGLCFGSDMALWHVSLMRTSVATSTLLVNTTPIYVAFYTLAVLRERLPRGFVAGAALALVGAAVLVGLPTGGPESSAGALLALTAAVFYAGYLLLMQAARGSSDAMATVFVAAVSAAAILACYGLAAGDAFVGFPVQSWAMMGAAAVVSHLGGVVAIVWALRFVPAAVASVVLLTQPVGTAIWGWLLLGEALSWTQAVGGSAVLAGIVVVSRSTALPPPPGPAD